MLGLIAAGGKVAWFAAALGLWLESINFTDRFNGWANLFGGVLLFYMALRMGRSKTKDNTIKELQDSRDAKDGRIRELRDENEDLEKQKRQIEQAASHCQQEAVKWQSKYEELQQYTAESAVLHFEAALAKHSETVAGRHELLLDHDERLLEQGTAMARTLERVAETLDTLVQKLA